MRKDIYVLIGMIILVGVGFVSGSIYINEVELNPAGNDTNFEWIELYNNGASVNLSGWYIIDEDDNNYALPAVIITNFYVLDSLSTLDNTDASFRLFNNLGILQDTTGNLTDSANNIKTQQRIPDGTGSFVFYTNTKGSINSDNIRNVPSEYVTIQSAINAANAGDVVNVADGTYTEDLIINASKDNLELNATGSNVVIKGVQTSNAGIPSSCPTEPACGEWPLARASIEILSDNVKIHGFKIESPNYTVDRYSSGIVIGGKNIEIYDNKLIINSADSTDEISQVIQTYSSSAISGVDISGLNIHDNTFTHKGIGSWGYEGIYINPDAETSLIYITDNDFSGKVFRAITSERSKTNIKGNIIITDLVVVPDDWSSAGAYQGINIKKFNLNSQSQVIINNNVIKGSDASKGFNQAIRLGQAGQSSLDVDILDNEIKYNKYGIFSVIGNNGDVNFNDFSNNVFGVNNAGSLMNAEKNYWGACDGPSGNGSGSGSPVSANVKFSPWLGICFANKTNESCAFEDRSAQISAELSGYEINKVWFSYFINSVNYNKTALHVGGNKYSYSITASELVKGNVTWNIYANDSFGNKFNNSWKTFYVRGNTEVVVDPLSPNGLNGWYVTEPLFSLLSDAGLNSYYQWGDTGNDILYSAPFRLENISNPSNVTAGKLKLNWWSEFVCGNETKQNQTFKIDLTSPVIEELTPENNSVVYQNDVLVSAYLDEVYGTNSGINLSSVIMKIDSVEVDADVSVADSLDATVSFNTKNLSDGEHNASVYAVDKAGRVSELTWFFNVDTSLGDFKLIVNSPADGIYGDKRIGFNLNVSKKVNEIEYINYNDRNPDWKRLCKNCYEYGSSSLKRKTLNEGWNNLSFRAVNDFGFSEEVNRMVFIDSKKPKISKILPKKNSVTNGSNFHVKYTEDNLKNILVNLNSTSSISSCNEAGENKECYFNLNLSSYDGQEIEYSINVSDDLRSVESDKIKIKVDKAAPVLNVNSPENKTGEESYNKKVPFNISVSEEVILEYYDETFSRPSWKKLCSKCNSYGVDKLKTKSFDESVHEVLIRAVDGAGNSDVEMVRFEVV